MRDTCCAQSMILEGSLPFSEVSATGENVLIQGIGMDIISVPLHRINLKFDLISGTVIVGVRPELPVKGVSMLLWNDLAGGKVLPQPIRRVYHIVEYLQVGVYLIVAYHDRNFIRKWTSGICRVRKLYRV